MKKQIQPTDVIFCVYAREWLRTYKVVRSNNSSTIYQNIINHLFNVPGLLKPADIRRMHFQLLINNAINKTRTCQQIILTFKQFIQCAVDNKYFPVTAVKDICDSVEQPKYKATEKPALTAEELKGD